MSETALPKPKWFRQPHPSSWLALLSIAAAIFACNATSYPFAAAPEVAARYFADVALTAIRWLAYAVSAISVASALLALPSIRRFGIHVVVYASAAFLLLGSVLRCLSLAFPGTDTRGTGSFVLAFVGTVVMACALAPFQVAGTLVSTTFPRHGRVLVHAVVRAHFVLVLERNLVLRSCLACVLRAARMHLVRTYVNFEGYESPCWTHRQAQASDHVLVLLCCRVVCTDPYVGSYVPRMVVI